MTVVVIHKEGKLLFPDSMKNECVTKHTGKHTQLHIQSTHVVNVCRYVAFKVV